MNQTATSRSNASPLMQWLGYLGLIPFVLLSAIASFELFELHTQSLAALELYAFGIIAFLCGTAWPKDDALPKNWKGLISNGLFLVAFFGFVFLPSLWPILAASLLVIIHFLEHKTKLLGEFSDAYNRMRCKLTLVASLSLAIAYATTA